MDWKLLLVNRQYCSSGVVMFIFIKGSYCDIRYIYQFMLAITFTATDGVFDV